MIYLRDKKVAVQFVEDALNNSEFPLRSITITNPAKSEGFCAIIVTDTSSEDIAVNWELRYLKQLIST